MENKKKNFDYERLANMLLDNYCEATSPRDAIKLLIKSGYKQEDLLFLSFNQSDISQVREDLKQEGWKEEE